MSQLQKLLVTIAVAVIASSANGNDDKTNNAINPKTVLVAGATGQTGRHIVRRLVDRGYIVRAMSRSAERAAELGPTVQPVVADVTQPETLGAAVTGVDVVISAIGGRRPIGENGFKSVDFEGNQALIDAAKAAGVRRFLVITGGSAGREGFLYELPFGPYPWKARAEAHLRASGLDYTIVAPGGLSDEPGGQLGIAVRPRVNYEVGQISREDVADFIIACMEMDQTIGKTLTIVSQPTKNDWREASVQLPRDSAEK
jgi:uncharacterized protein YbjT (DUF2867 family)